MALILIVDDDESVRRLVRRIFERAGYQVVEAASAFEALELLAAGPLPDAVVSDVLMPGMSGLDFYQTLVAHQPGLRHRFVFLTGANSEPIIARPIEDLGVPLLGKLDDLRLVVDAVQVALLREQD